MLPAGHEGLGDEEEQVGRAGDYQVHHGGPPTVDCHSGLGRSCFARRVPNGRAVASTLRLF